MTDVRCASFEDLPNLIVWLGSLEASRVKIMMPINGQAERLKLVCLCICICLCPSHTLSLSLEDEA